jgi:hypothetical protein
VVDDVSSLFASRLSELIDSSINKPLLKTVSGTEYSTLSDIVRFGDHLDHFHSYKSPLVPSPKQTIDFHTDEGLFIAIAPAVMLHNGIPTEKAAGQFLAKINGQESVIHVSQSSLLFMLGDGVNQYVNSKLKSARTTRLQAVEHALQMPDGVPLESRAWYGRMFLPPADALNPRYGVTFGELRQRSMAAQGDHTKSVATLGCSRNLIARSLAWGDVPVCNASSLLCWMACVPFTETLNKDFCASQNMGFNCTNDLNDQISPKGDEHGSFRLRCTNSTTIYSPPPTVAPLTSACSLLSSTLLANYDYKKVLGPSTILMWKVPVNGEVSMALVKDQSHVGYIGFGIANPDDTSGCKGMLGGHVILGVQDQSNVVGITPISNDPYNTLITF